MNKIAVARLSDLPDRKPAYALVANTDLVVVRVDDCVQEALAVTVPEAFRLPEQD